MGMLAHRTEDTPTYIAYTDSGYHICRNGGAYAYVLLERGVIIRKEAFLFRRESNNRGELHAIIAAVESLPVGADVEIRTDSQYAFKTLTGEWLQRSNPDLFARWHELVRGRKLKVKVVWIRAHSGDIYNQMCDDLCCETADILLKHKTTNNPAALLRNADQAKSVMSIWDVADGKMYHMDYSSDYMLDTLLQRGCKSSADLARFLYVNLLETKPGARADFDHGCSAFMAKTPDGDVICGRNFDYRFVSSANVFVDNRPVDGRSVRSLGIASLPFLDAGTYVAGSLSDGKTDISPSLASVYCTMDGMNANGVFISVLSLRGGGAKQHDPAKKDIVTTLFIRAVLDRAASVGDALDICRAYNFFSDGEDAPKSSHFLIADRTGRCVVLEYMLKDDPENWEMNVIEGQDYVANMYFSPGQAEGVGQWRQDMLRGRLAEKDRVLTEEDAMQLLKDVHQTLDPEEVTSNTQWSVVYNLTKGTAAVCVDKDYTRTYRFSL